jgi:hypothetical protein
MNQQFIVNPPIHNFTADRERERERPKRKLCFVFFTKIFCYISTAPSGPGPPLWGSAITHTTFGRTSLDEWPDNTQHSQETDIHAPGGIRTRNPNKRAPADPRFRPRGHGDRLAKILRGAILLWTQRFDRRCVCIPTVYNAGFQFDELCGLRQISVSWAICGPSKRFLSSDANRLNYTNYTNSLLCLSFETSSATGNSTFKWPALLWNGQTVLIWKAVGNRTFSQLPWWTLKSSRLWRRVVD